MEQHPSIFQKCEATVTHLRKTGLLQRTFLVGCRVIYLVILPFPIDAAQPVHCPDSQTAELGELGYIHCNFTEDFTAVYWFDDILLSSTQVIQYQVAEGVKSGPGFERGEYDIADDGSLIIQNVTKWHERTYRFIISRQGSRTPDNHLISLRVIASPVNELSVTECDNCTQDYYYSVMKGDVPSFSFNDARPPVYLEWFEHFHDGYNYVEIQQFNITQNRNGTYNSIATLHSLKDSNHLVHLLVCMATWPLSDWRKEKEILLDFSSSESFSDVIPKVLHMEINRYAKIQCGQSASTYVIWKRILYSGEPEMIGFHSHTMTETIVNTPNVEVSPEGSLIFSSPQIHHEGIYACIHGDGQHEEIVMTSIEILVPPSPPYIQIVGCDDASHSCFFKENSTQKLTCAVNGVHPTPTLEWIAENEDEITFFNHNTVIIRESGGTTDIILSVEYEVSQDVLCGEEILIQCHLRGPLSKIMKAESTALVMPASCKENEVEGGLSTEVWVLVILMVVLIFAVLMVLTRLYRMKSANPPKSAYNGVSTDEPRGTGAFFL